MDFVNQLAQEALEARTRLRELLKKQALGESLSAAEGKERTFLEQDIERLEREHVTERARLDAETAELLRRPSGRISGAWPAADADSERDDTTLPALPARTRRALARMFPAATLSEDDRRQSFGGIVAAALGGQALHPAVLAASQSEGVPADGGFTLHPDIASGLIVRALEASVFLSIGARFESMTSSERTVVALDDADETDDAEAGLTAGWSGESEAGTAQKVALRKVNLKANKLAIFGAVPNELYEDAPADFLRGLEGALARAISKKLDRTILSGTGAGMPLGILNAPAKIEVAKETSQTAATFVWANATKMFARLAAGSHERAWWLMNPTLLPSALAMYVPIGTTGAIPPAAFQGDGRGGYRLLGRPVLVSSRLKVAGTPGDVILVDPTQLAVGIRRAIAVERSEHVLFQSDALALRATFRGDARPLWDAARTPAEGSTTTSPYITLAERS